MAPSLSSAALSRCRQVGSVRWPPEFAPTLRSETTSGRMVQGPGRGRLVSEARTIVRLPPSEPRYGPSSPLGARRHPLCRRPLRSEACHYTSMATVCHGSAEARAPATSANATCDPLARLRGGTHVQSIALRHGIADTEQGMHCRAERTHTANLAETYTTRPAASAQSVLVAVRGGRGAPGGLRLRPSRRRCPAGWCRLCLRRGRLEV